ncbi:MAG: hypothetical protein ACI88A_001389 [Paraglaciecola sp.]|jgi:hypothetical protein
MRLLFLFTLFFSVIAEADLDCEITLNYGVVVNKTQIRVINESRTLYQINNDSQLFVAGEWLELDESQQKELQELSQGIHYVVPKMILLANEGVELAIDTVEQVYIGLVGKDHKTYEKLQSSLNRVKMGVKEKFIHANDNFYMGPGSLESVDDLVDRELEEQMEEAMSTSLGGILSAIGGLVTSDENTEDKMEKLARQLETMGEEIERNTAPRAQSLKSKAEWFCNKFKELDGVEERLRKSIVELNAINVLEVGGGN